MDIDLRRKNICPLPPNRRTAIYIILVHRPGPALTSIRNPSNMYRVLIPPPDIVGVVLTFLPSTHHCPLFALLVPHRPLSMNPSSDLSPAPRSTSWGNNYRPKSVRPTDSPSPNSCLPRFRFPVWRIPRSRHCHLAFRTSSELPAAPASNSTTSSSVKPTGTIATLRRNTMKTWTPP